MNELLRVIEESYACAKELGLTANVSEFCEGYLDRNASYLTSMKARDRCPSQRVLLALEDKLEALLRIYGCRAAHETIAMPDADTSFLVELECLHQSVKSARLRYDELRQDA
ncbi:MAG: DUF6626 family protein [Anaerolineales bacterium]